MDDIEETHRIEERTGQSRHIRQLLRAARESQGWTQQQVADKITERLQLERSLTGAAVSEWERFGRHPPINVFAAWARSLGRRLVVQLDESAGDRVAVMLRPETADLARAIDLLGDADRALVDSMVSRMKPRKERL